MNNRQKQTPLHPKLKANYQAEISLSFDKINYSDISDKAKREGFKRNKDFHITVIGIIAAKAIKSCLTKLDQTKRKKMLEKIQELLKSFNWSFKLSQRYHVKKNGKFNEKNDIIENRESYIQILYLPAMERFYSKLNGLMGLELDTQISHVTLFTKGESKNPDYYGIPIPSKEEFDNMDPQEI